MANNMYFDTFDHFDSKQVKSEWSFKDVPLPLSPYREYTCKHCGASKVIQLNESFSTYEQDTDKKERTILRDHLDLCPKFNKEKQYKSILEEAGVECICMLKQDGAKWHSHHNKNLNESKK